ncbi:hypothetical protein [Poseidonocella sedimentorum]|uniref:Phasin protein n=1 Tax=Poseidonocella sedimentorum TaxID=871652 RepID=A0A1I6DVQ2_9RHOB|nr:hypothetical protein [Poseidonocella sedimentorum]SFR09447.1 Phasin protein [Poseidonocella sedimentorum]
MSPSRKQDESAAEPQSPLDPDAIIRTFTEIQAAGLGPVSWLGVRWLEATSDMGAEWLAFLAGRVREDVRLHHELLHAGTADRMQHIQARFLQKALDDYRDETGKLVEICGKAMEEIHREATKVPAGS